MIDESADLALVSAWLEQCGLTATRFTQAEMQVGKTPDFRVVRGGELVAYCEVKSPNDPWLDEKLEEVPAFTIVGGARSDPTFNRLANEEDIGRRDRTCALLRVDPAKIQPA